MIVRRVALTQGDQLYVEIPHRRLKCLRSQPRNQMPEILLQQLLAKLLVAGQKQSVLRQNDTGSAAFDTEFQTTIEKHCGQIVFGSRIIFLAEIA